MSINFLNSEPKVASAKWSDSWGKSAGYRLLMTTLPCKVEWYGFPLSAVFSISLISHLAEAITQ